MPKGPRAENRPADVIGAAIKAAKIATGEEAEDLPASGEIEFVDPDSELLLHPS